jgi:CRISPR-associated protein Cmr2
VQLRTFSNEFKIRSVPAIAARTAKHDDVEVAQEATTADKYIAAIAFDGDSIGAWLNGDRLPKDEGLAKHHENFSKALSNFALNEVIEIVMGTKAEKDEGKFKGQLIYAGGDDVIALVPADAALEIAAALRTAFRLSTKGTPSTGEKPDASAGIAIAHIRSPLQDLIREAKQAEKDAKNKVGRPAFSVTLMKRSGEISKWGGKWSDVKVRSEDKDKPDTAITHTLYHEIDNLVMTGRLSARFPHRICGLLASYLTARTGISKLEDDIIDSDRMVCLIHLEFHYAAVRQGSKEVAEQLDPHLKSYLDGIVANFVPPSDDSKPALNQVMLQSVIGLCTTLAFARRSVTTESLLATAP